MANTASASPFNDGSAKTIDFRGCLKGSIFEPLHDVDQFKKFFMAGSTIAWPNERTLPPETLYAYEEHRHAA